MKFKFEKDSSVTEKKEQATENKPYKDGQKLNVPRTNGQIEGDWEVSGYNDKGEVIVIKKQADGSAIKKEISYPEIYKFNQYKTGDLVSVKRTSGEVQFGWTVKAIACDKDGKLLAVGVSNVVPNKNKPVEKLITGEEDLAFFTELNPFVKGDLITVRRTNGAIEDGWQVAGMVRDTDGKILSIGVIKGDLKKKYKAEDIPELKNLNKK